MLCSNVVKHDLPFDEYLKLPGWSYSGITSDGTVRTAPTAKMQLGTDVHNYLLTPKEYHYKNLEIVKPLAIAVKSSVGSLFPRLQAELAVTADFESQSFVMPYKGRIDLCIQDLIVIDLKVTEMDIQSGIKFFGYPNQLNGYAAPMNARHILIFSIHPKTKKVTITNIPIDLRWWEYQIIQRGEPKL